MVSYQPIRLLKTDGIPQEGNKNAVTFSGDMVPDSQAEIDWVILCNYKVDPDWLFDEAPHLLRVPRVVLFHGMKDPVALKALFEAFAPNFRLAKPYLPEWGTHHTKACLTATPTGLRLVIHTANLVRGDFHAKTQAAWIQDFPRKEATGRWAESPFERDLVEYFSALTWPLGAEVDLPGGPRVRLRPDTLREYDFTSCGGQLVASVPGTVRNGRHVGGATVAKWGHLKLRALLAEQAFPRHFEGAPLVYQFSSMGSLDEPWLTRELGASMAAGRVAASGGDEATASVPASGVLPSETLPKSSSVSVPGQQGVLDATQGAGGQGDRSRGSGGSGSGGDVKYEGAAASDCSTRGIRGNVPDDGVTNAEPPSKRRKTLEQLGPPRSVAIIYPTVEEVRTSLQGYVAGDSLPSYRKNMVKPFLAPMYHRWGDHLRRGRAMPHIKTYVRYAPTPVTIPAGRAAAGAGASGHGGASRDGRAGSVDTMDRVAGADGSIKASSCSQGAQEAVSIAWLLLTSANLSKAAWGKLEKGDAQMWLPSYEMGVLLLPAVLARAMADRWWGFDCMAPMSPSLVQQDGVAGDRHAADGPSHSTHRPPILLNRAEGAAMKVPSVRLVSRQPSVDASCGGDGTAGSVGAVPAASLGGGSKIKGDEAGSIRMESTSEDELVLQLPIPYRLPPDKYQNGDRVWMWDSTYDVPDVFSRTWPLPGDD
eukprot:jgi/Mesvir1/22682/Mv14105-RA.1